jgi:hypothetical protein
MLLDGITLPDGLIWVDQYSWTPVAQNVSVSLAGVMLLQEAVQAGGRPITLEGGDDQSWATRAAIDALYAMAMTADKVMSLDLGIDGIHQVVWRRDQPPIAAEPVLRTVGPTGDTIYAVMALRFMEI